MSRVLGLVPRCPPSSRAISTRPAGAKQKLSKATCTSGPVSQRVLSSSSTFVDLPTCSSRLLRFSRPWVPPPLAAMEPSSSSSANPPKNSSVRVRRSTTVSASRSPFATIAEGVPPLPSAPSDSLPNAPAQINSGSLGTSSGSPTRRRRGATITERLFSSDLAYAPLAGQEGGAIRSRSGSTTSGGSGPARAVPPVVIHYRGRSDSGITGEGKVEEGSVAEHHAEDEVDLVRLLAGLGCIRELILSGSSRCWTSL